MEVNDDLWLAFRYAAASELASERGSTVLETLKYLDEFARNLIEAGSIPSIKAELNGVRR